MNINTLSIILVRDIYKEQFILSPGAYHPFSPAKHNLNDIYLQINHRRKDHLCYIKYKNKDLWLYEKNGKPVFLPLHCKKYGYDYDYPTVYWIEYIKEPTFIMYKPKGYNNPELYYLQYKEDNDKIIVSWEKDIKKATIFSFTPAHNEELVNDNRSSMWR